MRRLIEVLAVGVTDDSGNPLQNGTVHFYDAGTTNLRTVYQDFAETSTEAHDNPATLDAAGRLIAYSSRRIKLVIRSSEGDIVRTIDNVGTADSDLSTATASDLAGSGLTAPGNGTIAVNPDGTTIVIESDTLKIAAKTVQTKTANYTALSTDDVIICNTAGGAFTVTLPAASTMTRRTLTIRRLVSDTSANLLTIDGNSSETIDGQATIALNVHGWATIVSDGSNWQLLDHNYGYQVSSSCGAFTTTSTSLTDVTNLSVAVATNGRRVRLSLVSTGDDSNDSYAYVLNSASSATVNFNGYWDRGGTVIGAYILSRTETSAETSQSLRCPVGAIAHVDQPSAGTYTYKFRVKAGASTQTQGLANAKLLAEVI